MKIDLMYLLAKNKTSLKEFLVHHNIDNYQELTELCENRRFNAVTEEYYNEHSGKEVLQQRDEKQNKTLATKEKPESKTTKSRAPTKRRRTSTSQKKQVSRTSSKKVKDT